MNKKGLIGGIMAIMVVLFLFSLISLLVLTMWNQYNGVIQDMPEDFVDNSTKQQIDDLTVYLLWSDKIFIFVYVCLMIAYLISAVTLPVEKPVFMIIFAVFLFVITILAMIFSNAWQYLISNPNFVEAASELPFTDFVMHYFPIITFFIGIAGGVLFYSRSRIFTAEESRGDVFE